jgi:hypothetical protein
MTRIDIAYPLGKSTMSTLFLLGAGRLQIHTRGHVGGEVKALSPCVLEFTMGWSLDSTKYMSMELSGFSFTALGNIMRAL